MVKDKEGSIKSGLEQARRDYAAEKERVISSEIQELSVAKFEIDHLPDRREVYMKRGCLLFLTPREEARASLEAREQELGEKLAFMEKLSSGAK